MHTYTCMATVEQAQVLACAAVTVVGEPPVDRQKRLYQLNTESCMSVCASLGK